MNAKVCVLAIPWIGSSIFKANVFEIIPGDLGSGQE